MWLLGSKFTNGVKDGIMYTALFDFFFFSANIISPLILSPFRIIKRKMSKVKEDVKDKSHHYRDSVREKANKAKEKLREKNQ